MKWKAEAWKSELYKAQLCSDFFTPEGEYGLPPRAPMNWPCSGL